MKKLLLIIAYMAIAVTSWAYDICKDGLYYNILSENEQACEVTFIDENYASYSGNVTVPASIIYEGKVYSVIRVGQYAFSGCKSLEQVMLPESVKYIGDFAFNECVSLKSINLSNSITHLGDRCFYKCSSLASVTIPSSITRIPDRAFSECISLEKITIPSGVECLGYDCFSYCRNLKSINFPATLKVIENYALYNCFAIEIIDIENIESYCNVSVGGSNALYIGGKDMYVNGELMTDLKIPEGIKVISSLAFGCFGLQSISIPASLEQIEGGRFNSWGLKAYYVDSNNNYFSSCDGVLFNKEQTELIHFPYNSDLLQFEIPNTIQSIAPGTFSGAKLKSIIIPESVTSIEDNAFSASAIESVTIPNSVTQLGKGVFRQCESLTTATLPDGITTISESLFEGSGIQSIVLPNSVTTIEKSAFKGCGDLLSIDFPESLTALGQYSFYSCVSLTSIVLPNSIKYLDINVFGYCQHLKRVQLPSDLVSIDSWAFLDCDLEELLLPASLKSIGDQAFLYNNKLAKVTIMCETPPSCGYMSFPNPDQWKIGVLYVPQGCIDSYSSKLPWTNFIEIHELDGDDIGPEDTKKCATPTISFIDGKLVFESETEDAVFHYQILSGKTDLSGTVSHELDFPPMQSYSISCFATADGYEQSEVATKTLNISLGDTNGDGVINIGDVTTLVNKLLQK